MNRGKSASRKDGNWKDVFKVPEKLDAFLSIGIHAEPPKERTCPPLHYFAYRKESECTCNLII